MSLIVYLIVIRNCFLGMVREVQERTYDNRLIGVSLDGSPDFCKIAEAYGIEHMLVNSEQSAVEGIGKLISSDKPYLLEVVVPEHEKTIL